MNIGFMYKLFSSFSKIETYFTIKFPKSDSNFNTDFNFNRSSIDRNYCMRRTIAKFQRKLPPHFSLINRGPNQPAFLYFIILPSDQKANRIEPQSGDSHGDYSTVNYRSWNSATPAYHSRRFANGHCAIQWYGTRLESPSGALISTH